MSQRSLVRLPLVLAALLLLLLGAACSGDDSGDDTSADDPGTASTDSGATDSGAAGDQPASGTCTYTEDGQQAAKKVDPPPSEPKETGKVDVTMKTNVGDIGATLDASTTPCTVNSFLSLAEQGYFDDTKCHRLTTQGIFVLQCGDPTATGMGGPGYSFDDELSGSETYGAGTLAMANAGPNTNGSQFFIVFDDSQLPPSYTVFGEVGKAGLGVVQKVAEKGTQDGGPDGPPKQPVTISGIS
ncbi:peptidylprolyl isomerase [Nocardioides guangzhouensis]|uniref:Peptidyl-prolyl cis-trans isomerase n=1 Tax=Nocardioides guangzhouensis TaxID=2497878 RepID=A0A4Q4ZGY2_9ACTN|nr:peptidylprolyl isomerase [Nocardioides guangzhouensis]RYP87078.1 peptidylprolyl isomerase [Nocardioides guangzhouensis]